MATFGENAEDRKRRLLIVEDDIRVLDSLLRVFQNYSSAIDIRDAHDAEHAWRAIVEWQPDAVILDVMLDYGAAGQLLKSESDPHGNETGLRLLRLMRDSDRGCGREVWVAVTTARSEPSIVQSIITAVDGNGQLYLKPFDDLRLEWDVCNALGVECDSDVSLLLKPPP